MTTSSEVLVNGEDVSEDPTRDVAIKAANYALEAAAQARETKNAAVQAQRAAQRTERHVETAVSTISGRVSQVHGIVRDLGVKVEALDGGMADRDARIARELAELRQSVQTALELVARTSSGLNEVREKSPSKHDLDEFGHKLDHAVEVIEEATTSPGVTIRSDRVREIVETELVVKEHGKLSKNEEKRQDARTAIKVTVIGGLVLAFMLFAAGIAFSVARAFTPAVSLPHAAPGLAP